jgi:hypothetical protein
MLLVRFTLITIKGTARSNLLNSERDSAERAARSLADGV